MLTSPDIITERLIGSRAWLEEGGEGRGGGGTGEGGVANKRGTNARVLLCFWIPQLVGQDRWAGGLPGKTAAGQGQC